MPELPGRYEKALIVDWSERSRIVLPEMSSKEYSLPPELNKLPADQLGVGSSVSVVPGRFVAVANSWFGEVVSKALYR